MTESKVNSVLIVDDTNANILALTDILKSEYTIYAAKNGQKAIELAEEFMPDVILLDIVMPEMDGYEVIARLKNSERAKDIPVIFITSLNDSGNEEKGLELGAADYISKPFSPGIVRLRAGNQIRILELIRNIERLSLEDQLTGLPNRRSFDRQIDREWKRAAREKTFLSVLLMDIDKFKVYNDTYGHQQGDAAIKSFAKTLEKTLKRPGDFCARWGGEEFIALLANTDLKNALDIAEKIRRNTEDTEVPCSNGLITKLTVSIGVNTYAPGDGNTIDNLISGADAALYAAKNKGRNMVCNYTESTGSI